MMFIAPDRSVQLLLHKPRSRWFSLCCIGRKAHYRKDGSCKHTDEVLEAIRADVRSRVRITPRGGRS